MAGYLTIAAIQARVAEHYGLHVSTMTSQCRKRVVARPRQVEMFLAPKLSGQSLPQIGKRFGGRDHTTVMHAMRAVDSLRASDSALDVTIFALGVEMAGGLAGWPAGGWAVEG